MRHFCKEVVEAIKPLIQYEGEYDVKIANLPLRDENDKLIKKHKTHVQVRPVGDNEEDYTLTVYLNTREDDSKNLAFFMNRGFDVYLENLGVEICRQSILVLTCLHEFGHVNMILECKNNGSLNNFNSAVHINENASKMIFPIKHIKDMHNEHQDSIRYRYSFSENYADKFALIHFMKVWNQVKHLV